MSYLEIGKENSGTIELHYHDHGRGQPIVLIHGWPLSERSWEKQEPVLLAQGYRVITYDRRGFGESSKPSEGYNYDTLADDLNALMIHLDLREAVLVGFSMGTGEVARYLNTYGSERVAKAVLISGILPALLKSDENPEGIDQSVFDEMIKNCVADRPAFIQKFLGDFYSHNMLGNKNISEESIHLNWITAAMASPIATVKCISAWLEDFRRDVANISVPTMVIHGDSDRILPIAATGHRTRGMLPGCKYVEIKGGPHGVLATHADEINRALMDFLSERVTREVPTQLRH